MTIHWFVVNFTNSFLHFKIVFFFGERFFLLNQDFLFISIWVFKKKKKGKSKWMRFVIRLRITWHIKCFGCCDILESAFAKLCTSIGYLFDRDAYTRHQVVLTSKTIRRVFLFNRRHTATTSIYIYERIFFICSFIYICIDVCILNIYSRTLNVDWRVENPLVAIAYKSFSNHYIYMYICNPRTRR